MVLQTGFEFSVCQAVWVDSLLMPVTFEAHAGPSSSVAAAGRSIAAGGPSPTAAGDTETPVALGPFFWLAAYAPWVVKFLRPLAVRVVPAVSRGVRDQTRRNAERVFGRELSAAERRAFTRGVLGSFYDFVADVGLAGRGSVERLHGLIERVEGAEGYAAARSKGRGAVMVTAHMGSFEVGLAALTRAEKPGAVRVVFRRDASGPFETMRARMRKMLGVIEAPIDDGLMTWMDLRDALLADGVVVMQADRAMPGQRSEVVPFLRGHLRIPTGAVRLARMTGSPIVPVFTVRLPSGRFAVELYPAIDAGADESAAVRAMAGAIESVVERHPTQWLVLGAAFEEDASRG
jgi:KDO2-lipid IV(A) lauroyltransferase